MSAAASASEVIGWNCMPVATPERSAMGVESITVSTSPPV
jgi:hypothetical protein